MISDVPAYTPISSLLCTGATKMAENLDSCTCALRGQEMKGPKITFSLLLRQLLTKDKVESKYRLGKMFAKNTHLVKTLLMYIISTFSSNLRAKEIQV